MWKRTFLSQDKAEAELREKLFEIWARPLPQQATYKDLPRLGRHLSIVSVTDEKLFSANETLEEEASVLEIMHALTSHLENSALADAVEKELKPRLDIGPVTNQLWKYYEECVEGKTVLDPSKPTCKVLQALQQEMIFPIYRRFHEMLYERFPFKDVRGSWYVRVKLEKKGCITVSHMKRQQSHFCENDEEKFWFEWELHMGFDPKFHSMQVEYSITDYGFERPKKDSFFQKLFENAIAPFMHEAFIFRQVWQKPISTFSVSSLLKLAGNVDIWRQTRDLRRSISDVKSHGQSGLCLLMQSDINVEEVSDAESALRLISVLMAEVASKKEKAVWEQKVAELRGDIPSLDVGVQLKALLNDHTLFSESGRFVRLIKAITIDMVYPVIMELRERFYTFVKYKDVKGSWHLRVVFAAGRICVTISKSECSYNSKDETSYFKLGWRLKMEFKKDMSKMISARFSITSITFHINTSYSVVKDVLSLSSPYVEPSTHVHLVRSFPVVSVLSRLGISLAQSEVSCSVTLPHEDGVLTEGAISLLHETKSSLRVAQYDLPSVFLCAGKAIPYSQFSDRISQSSPPQDDDDPPRCQSPNTSRTRRHTVLGSLVDRAKSPSPPPASGHPLGATMTISSPTTKSEKKVLSPRRMGEAMRDMIRERKAEEKKVSERTSPSNGILASESETWKGGERSNKDGSKPGGWNARSPNGRKPKSAQPEGCATTASHTTSTASNQENAVNDNKISWKKRPTK